MGFEPIPDEVERTAHGVIGAAIEVHRHLGPGFLESIYRRALKYELGLRRFGVEEEQSIVVRYKDAAFEGQRYDLLVEQCVLVDTKCVERFAPIHEAQVISYLKTMDLRLGLLLNFQTELLKDGGIKRVVR